MNFVQPIRDKNKLEEIKDELRRSGTRDYLLFYTGINTRFTNFKFTKIKI